MAEETAVAEAPPPGIELSTPLGEVFDKAFGDKEEVAPTPDPEPAQEPVKEEKLPVKQEKAAPKAEEPAPKALDLPENLFGDIPEPKQEPVKDEVEPVKEEAPADLKGKARENFERLATAKHQAEKEAFDLRKRLKTAEAKAEEGDPGAKAKIRQLEDQLKDYSRRVEIADIRLHPRFQQDHALPRQQALEFAQKTYSEYGGDPKVLEEALNLTGKARIDKLDEIYGDITSKTVLSELEGAVNFVKAKDNEIAKVLEKSAEVAKQYKEQDLINESESLRQLEEQTKKNLTDARKTLGEKFGMAIFKTTDDPNFGWWNDQVTKMDQEAEHLMLKTSDQREMAIASYLAVAAPRLNNMFMQERKARIAVEKQFRDYKAGEPGLGGEAKIEPSTPEDDEKTPLATSIINSIKSAQSSRS